MAISFSRFVSSSVPHISNRACTSSTQPQKSTRVISGLGAGRIRKTGGKRKEDQKPTAGACTKPSQAFTSLDKPNAFLMHHQNVNVNVTKATSQGVAEQIDWLNGHDTSIHRVFGCGRRRSHTAINRLLLLQIWACSSLG